MTRDYRISAQTGSRKRSRTFSGAVHPMALVGMFVFFLSSIGYVYALNLGAVQGYEARKAESDIESLKEENRKLRLDEAQALSLSRIESSVRERSMDRITDMKTVGGRGAVALR
ncbi:MAG: hypothetical protein HGB18_01275 [Candidatus Moranbacteria bacterium]|nr:hypothetical protein [Candidatus Moranbacteria bacterium]